jgi:hypothetical protein
MTVETASIVLEERTINMAPTSPTSLGTVEALVKTITQRVPKSGTKDAFWVMVLGALTTESGELIYVPGTNPAQVEFDFKLDGELSLSDVQQAIADAGFPGFKKKQTNTKGRSFFSSQDDKKSLYVVIELSMPLRGKGNNVTVKGDIVDFHSRPKGRPNGMRLRSR